MARADFNKLQHVWRHTRLPRSEKRKIYLACVVSRLLCGLQTTVLGQAARNKLDGFHAKCARQICGIPPAYYSRIPNAKVLETLQAEKLTTLLLEQQLGFFGKLARRPGSCPVRQLVFESDLSTKLQTFERRRGRPRSEWCSVMHRTAGNMFESASDFRACVVDATAWRTYVRQYCRAKPL